MKQGVRVGWLQGERVVLEPMTQAHVAALSLAVSDGELWTLWYANVPHPDEMNAFETLAVMAVEFRTHWHNQASREAIARLGAKQDGVLRNHRLLKDGTVRDTVVYSIIDSEWPGGQRQLRQRMAQAS